MVQILKEHEAAPVEYPSVVPYWHTNYDAPLPEDATIQSAAIWQRIEAYVAYRWTLREVVWTVEGPGEFVPRLTPATITGLERWDGAAWESMTLPTGPLGGAVLAAEGPYRITATVGGGTIPQDVLEAWRRLHEYSRGIAESWKGETAIYRTDGPNGGMQRPSGWAGKAIQLSGAADLLRQYRRA